VTGGGRTPLERGPAPGLKTSPGAGPRSLFGLYAVRGILWRAPDASGQGLHNS